MLAPRCLLQVLAVLAFGVGVACARAGDAGPDTSSGGPSLGDELPKSGPGRQLGMLRGLVTAPQGSIPISGALVYVTDEQPADLPRDVYCNTCLELEPNSFTYSGPDGSFSLPVYRTGDRFIVTQKGSFRRVRRIHVQAKEAQDLPGELTRLPGVPDRARGDSVPLIGVVQGIWDPIQDALRELGVSNFDLGSLAEIAGDAKTMSKYQILLFPCTGDINTKGRGPFCITPKVPSNLKENLRDYVRAGGTVYASDWSYEYVRQTWPGFVSWRGTWPGQASTLGSACLDELYDGPAKFDDPSLADWMAAQGDTDVKLEGSGTWISALHPQEGDDEKGRRVLVSPKLWASVLVNGEARPSTVSFQDKCGRVLYSTYHVEQNAGLSAQAKALIHVLLEVSTCVGIQPTPPK